MLGLAGVRIAQTLEAFDVSLEILREQSLELEQLFQSEYLCNFEFQISIVLHSLQVQLVLQIKVAFGDARHFLLYQGEHRVVKPVAHRKIVLLYLLRHAHFVALRNIKKKYFTGELFLFKKNLQESALARRPVRSQVK